jgi:acyl-CoA synthetase (NDP forming)
VEVATAILRGAHDGALELAGRGFSPKPVLSCFMGSHGVPEGLRSLQQGHIPSYPFPESAAIALAHAVRHARWRTTPEGKEIAFADLDVAAVRAVAQRAAKRATLGDTAWLSADEVRELLGAAGLPRVPEELCITPGEAAQAAKRIGFPVAVKLASGTLTHKTDVGGVRLGVANEEEVRRAFADIGRRLDEQGLRSQMDGVIVQPMVTEGVEVIVGMTKDPSFGPVLMFGLGGVLVEILRDVAFRVCPLTDRDAHELVRDVRGYRLLEGWRGAPPADTVALEHIILRVSQMVRAVPEIAELDLNPIRVLPGGRGCRVVDARVAVRG